MGRSIERYQPTFVDYLYILNLVLDRMISKLVIILIHFRRTSPGWHHARNFEDTSNKSEIFFKDRR